MRKFSSGVSLLALCISSAAFAEQAGSGPIADPLQQDDTEPSAATVAADTASLQAAGNLDIYYEIPAGLSIIDADIETPSGNSLLVQAQAAVRDAISQVVNAPNADVSSMVLNSGALTIGAEATASGTSDLGNVVSTASASLIGGLHQEATVEGGGEGAATAIATNTGSYTGYAAARTSSDGDATSDAVVQEGIFMRGQANGAGDGTTRTTFNNLGTLQFNALADSLSSAGAASSTAHAGGGEHGLIHLRGAANGVGLDSATVDLAIGADASLGVTAISTAQGALIAEATASTDGALVMKAQGNGQDNADIAIAMSNAGSLAITTSADAASTGPASAAGALATMNSAIVQTSEESGPSQFVGRSGTVAITNIGDITIGGASRAAAPGSAEATTLIEAAILQEAENLGYSGTAFGNSGTVHILGSSYANGLDASALAAVTGIEQELFGLGAGGDGLAAFENTGEVTLAVSAEAAAAGGAALADAGATGFRVWGEPVNIAADNSGLFSVSSIATGDGPAHAAATGMAFLATWNPTIIVPEEEEGHGHGGGAGEHGNGQNGHGGPGEDEEGPVVWEEAATNAITGSAFNGGLIHVSASAMGSAALAGGADITATANALQFEAAAIAADFTNSGTILAEAVTNGGVSEARGIWVLDYAESPIEPLSSDFLLILNSGGTIFARTSTDAGSTWSHGMAIDAASAPNRTEIGFTGSSFVYGNIDISPVDVIGIAAGRLTFDGTINPDAALQGSLLVGSGGTLFLTNPPVTDPAYDGPARAYMDTFSVASGGTLGLQLSPRATTAARDMQSVLVPATVMSPPYPQVFADTATLDGSLLLAFTTPSGLYDDYYSWEDVIDANTLTGVFVDVAVESGSLLLDPAATYDAAANVDASISRVPFDDGRFGLTPNQQSAASGVEQVYSSALTGPFAGMVADMFTMTDPAAYASALGNLHGAQYATYMQSLGRMGSRFNAVLTDMGGCGALEITDETLRCRRENEAGIWGSAAYARDRIDSDPAIDATGYRSDQYQLAIGGDVRLGNAGVIGVAGGYTSNKGDFDWYGGRAETDGWQVGAYGAYDPGPAYIRAAASYTSLSGTASRDVKVGALSGSAAANFDGDIWAVGGEIGYRIPARFVTATPYAGFDWVSAHLDGFTETGTAPGRLVVGDSTNDFLSSEMGVRLAANLGPVLTRANVGWRHEFNGTPAQFSASYAEQPGSVFRVLGPHTGPDSVVAGLAFAVDLSDRLSARLGYEGQFGSAASDNAVYGGLAMRLGSGLSAAPAFSSGLLQTLAPVLKLDFEMAGIYDDNIFASRNDKIDDFILALRPSARVQFGDSRTYLELGGRGDVARNIDNTSENYTDWTIDWDSRVRLLDGVSLILNGNYLWTHEARTSPEAVFGLSPTRYRRGYGATGLMVSSNDWIARLVASGTTFDFNDTPTSFGSITNDDRDRTGFDVALRLGHQVVPSSDVFVQATYGSTHYDRKVDDFGFRRNSDGIDLVAGLQRRKQDGLSGEIFAGLLQRSFDDPALPDISTFDIGMLVDWEGSRSNATFRVDRGIDETTFAGASAYLHTDGTLTISAATGPQLATGVTLYASQYDYVGIDLQELVLGAGLWTRYWLNNHIFAGAGYDFTQRTSNVASYSYNENRFQLSIGAQLPPRYIGAGRQAAWNGGSQAPAGAYAAVLLGHGTLVSALAGPRDMPAYSTADFGNDGFSYGLAAGYGVTWEPVYLGLEVTGMRAGPDWQHAGAHTFSIDRGNSAELSARAGFVTRGRGLVYGRFGYVTTRLDTAYDSGTQSIQLGGRTGGVGVGLGIDAPAGAHGFVRAEYVVNSYRDYDATLAGGTADNFANHEGQFRLGIGMRLGRVNGNAPDDDVLQTDFSGPYVGLSLGHGALVTHAVDMLAGQVPVDATRSNHGGILGVFAGYGVTMRPLYIGAEIEGDLSNMHWASTGDSHDGSGGTDYTLHREGSFGASARLGVIVGPEALLFGRIGAARARFQASYDLAGMPVSSSFWSTGLQAGVGLELGLSPRVRIRSEYLMRDYKIFIESDGMNFRNLSNNENLYSVGFSIKI